MAPAPTHRILARGRRGVATVVALICATAVLAGCGSSGSHAPGDSTANAGGLASRSPHQIIAAAQAALRSARSFVASGNLIQGGKTLRVQVIDDGASRLRVQISQGGRSAEIIATPGAGYVRANEQFWTAQAGASAARLANRWIELPATESGHLSSGLGKFAPGTLARCLGENLGSLSRAGGTTVDGRRAVAIRQAATAPGTNPGTLDIAASGPAYPLRVTSTGPTRPGGKVDVCNTGKGNDVQGSLTLDDFDHAPAVTAPKHPVKIGALAGSST